MDVTFGTVADTAPEGFLARRVHFTTLVELDTPTKEGFQTRKISSEGFGTRDLPRPITGDGPGRGHEGAFPVGRLDQVRISGTNVEAWGWLRNDEHGRNVFEELALGIVEGNSIEMTDVKYKIDFTWPDEEDDGAGGVIFTMPQVDITFTEANIGATTLVAKPAFARAKASLEEVTAALAIEDDLEVTASFVVYTDADEEITAGALVALTHDAFTVPEPDTYQPFQVSADGKSVSGHLGRWGVPHTGFLNKRVLIPRSQTNYASYCKRRRYTDKGEVFTGPIILLGGHKATADVINERLADPQYAWADVIVTDGHIGPWVCGTVRSGATDQALEVGSGSGISGHWVNGELYAICSVNAEGFDVARPTAYTIEAYDEGDDHYLAASFSLSAEDRLAAGYNPVSPIKTERPTVDERFAQVEYDQLLAAARAALEDDNADAIEESGLFAPEADDAFFDRLNAAIAEGRLVFDA